MPQAKPKKTVQRIDASDVLRLDERTVLTLARRFVRLDAVVATINANADFTGDRRLDAGETAMLARQLLFLRAKMIDRDYAILKARTLFPISTDVPPGADTHSVQEWDHTGKAKRISSYTDDLPRVDVATSETPRKIHGYGDSFGYSIQDLRAAAMGKVELESKKMRAARDVFDRMVEELAAIGDADGGLEGILNGATIPIVSLAAGGAWSGKTGDQVIADVTKLINSITTTTLGNNRATNVVMHLDGWQRLTTTARSATSDLTLLEFLQKAHPNTNFDFWSKCDNADAEGDGPRLLAYQNDEMVAELVISQDFEMFPPEARNLGFIVNCHGRCGGMAIHKPKAIAYMDGTAG